MANSDKNIRITTSRNKATLPNIVFTGSAAGNSVITLNVLDDNSIQFSSNEGVIFALDSNLTSGIIWSVNNVSGFPLLQASAGSTISLANIVGSVVGIGTDSPIYKFQTVGTAAFASTNGFQPAFFFDNNYSDGNNTFQVRKGNEIRFYNSANTFYAGLKSASTANTTYTLPASTPAGTANSILQSTPAGILSWIPNTPGTATTANNVNIAQSGSNSDFYIVLSDSTSKTGVGLSAGLGLSFNPNSNTLTTGKIIGTWAGSTITTLYGGTGYASFSDGDLLVGAGNSLIKLAKGNTGEVLSVIASTPYLSWSVPQTGAATTINVGTDDNNATRYIPFVNGNGGSGLFVSTDADLSYNPGTNALTVGIVNGNLSGTFVTASSFEGRLYGTATTATNVNLESSSSVNDQYIVISNSQSGSGVALSSNSTLTYNPSTQLFNVVNISGTAATFSGNVKASDFYGNLTGLASTSSALSLQNASSSGAHNLLFTPNSSSSGSAISTKSTLSFDPNTNILSVSGISITSGANSTSTTSGALSVKGGLGLTGNAFIGGTVTISDTTSSTSTSSGSMVLSGGFGLGGNAFIGGTVTIANSTGSGSSSEGALVVRGGLGVSGNIYSGRNIEALGSGTFRSLTSGRVVFSGTNGLLTDDSNFTYSSSTDSLTLSGTNASSPNLLISKAIGASVVTTPGIRLINTNLGSASNFYASPGLEIFTSTYNNTSGIAYTSRVKLQTVGESTKNRFRFDIAYSIDRGTADFSKSFFTALGTTYSNENGYVAFPYNQARIQPYATGNSSYEGLLLTPSDDDLATNSLNLPSPSFVLVGKEWNGSDSQNIQSRQYITAGVSVSSPIWNLELGDRIQITNDIQSVVYTNIISAERYGPVRISQAISGTSTTYGSLVVNGGLGVTGNAFIGGTITAPLFTGDVVGNVNGTAITANDFYGNLTGFANTSRNVNVVDLLNSTNDHYFILSPNKSGSGIALSAGSGISYNPSTNTLKIGGLGLSSSLFTTSSSSLNLFNSNATTINAFQSGTAISMGAASGTFTVNNSTLKLTQSTTSTNSTSGALVVSGGVGIGENLNVSGTASSISGISINSGVINSGTWSGSTISYTYGGTGQNSYTKGDILVADTGGNLVKFPVSGTDKDVLISSSYSGYGVSWFSLLTPTYGAFASTQTQSVTAAGTTVITFNTVFESNKVVGPSTGSTTRIYIQESGVFNVQFSAQVDTDTTNTESKGEIWFRKNGLDIDDSNTIISVSRKDYQNVLSLNFVSTFFANDYLELVMYSSTSDFQILAVSGTGRPDIPSVIFTVTPVSYVLPGSGTAISGIAALNNQTGANQTLQVGSSGSDFEIVSASNTHTFNLPDASGSARGVVSTGTQTLAGAKTFSSALSVSDSTAASSTSTGALKITGGAGIGGSLYVGDSSNIDGVILSDSTVTATLSGTATTARNVQIVSASTSSLHPVLFTPSANSSGSAISANGTLLYNPANDTLQSSKIYSTSSESAGFFVDDLINYTGAVYVEGGLAVSRNIIARNNLAIGNTSSYIDNSAIGNTGRFFFNILSRTAVGTTNIGFEIFDGIGNSARRPRVELLRNTVSTGAYNLAWRMSNSSSNVSMSIGPYQSGTNNLTFRTADSATLTLSERLEIYSTNTNNTNFDLGPATSPHNVFIQQPNLSGTDTNAGELAIRAGRSTGIGNPGTIGLYGTIQGTVSGSTLATTTLILRITGTGASIVSATSSTSISSGSFVIGGGLGLVGNAFIGGTVNITNTTTSSSTNSGALVVSGGVGVGGSVYIGGDFNIAQSSELRLQSSSFYTGFKAGAIGANYIYTLPTSFPASGTGNSILISNDSGVLDWASKSSVIGSGTSGYLPLWTNGGTELTNSITKQISNTIEVEGHFKALTKSFLIPHPLDPENSLLEHGSLEGPEHGVYFRGTALGIDEVKVDLPDYWSALVEDDYTIQITPRVPYNLYIKQQTKNSFIVSRIKYFWSSKKTIEFDYHVVGSRKDIKLKLTQTR